VGIGASAGGLEAFERFFKNMPPDNGMAFVLVPHLDPSHVSIMPELLQKYTQMKVRQAEDGIKVKPNCVYVISPNKNIAMLNGVLELMQPTEPRGSRLPIDFFFRSLAEDQGRSAICVILSGTGTDGTAGLKAIHESGGMVMVQSTDSAKYDGMPRCAIATGMVDYVLPPEKMPDQLIKYTGHTIYRQPEAVQPATEGIPDALQKIFILLRTHTGHDFSSYKRNTICRRIERRMNVHQIDAVPHYVRYLQQDPHEVEVLFKELLIGVTSFFRDPETFDVLRDRVLPKLLADKPAGYCARVWVPGCSSGEEAYSLAMILKECLDRVKTGIDFQIFATDIDQNAIDKARSGVYPNGIASDVSPERLRRFFTADQATYRVKTEVREKLIFALQNIITDPPFTKLDLICCRNLLIYLDGDLQKKILPILHYALKPDGILLLGSSETIGGLVGLFSVVDKKWKVFRRRETVSSARGILEFPVKPSVTDMLSEPAVAETATSQEVRWSQLVERLLLEDYAPPCVIVGKKGEVVFFHGRTGKYLEPAPGEPNLNVLDMARPGLKMELASALRKAAAQKQEVSHDAVRIKDDGGYRWVNLKVRPLLEPETVKGLTLVVFEEIAAPVKKKSASSGRSARQKPDTRVEEMERELMYSKENLQTTVEELETSNEELKSTNEELQSTNQELQSTNEEMETSKEELQSLNEELITVNAELQGRIDELTSSNDDIRNLLESTQIATIFLDANLQVKRYTPSATDIINLIHTDLGRPLKHLASNLKDVKLVEEANAVLKNLGAREAEVQAKDGRWYNMRILPYRTAADVIEGVVLTFDDITRRKEAEMELLKARDNELAQSIVQTVRDPLVVLDGEMRVVSANQAFYRTFKATKEKTEGKVVYELGDREWDIPQLRRLLERILPERASFSDFRVEHRFPVIGPRVILLNARKIVDPLRKEVNLILLSMEDVTDQGRSSRSEEEIAR
jgi:two-component system CheB/CheR fusion protein